MVEDVVHCLNIEALFHFSERRVYQMGKGHEKHQQSHVKRILRLAGLPSLN